MYMYSVAWVVLLKLQMFSISVGTNANAHGFCCIAVGDDTAARGAFQVSIGEKVTIPNETSKATAVATLHEIERMRVTYKSMCEQKFAPPEFASASSKAIDFLRDVLEKHFGKNYDQLIEELKNDSLEKKREVVDDAPVKDEAPKKLETKADLEKKFGKDLDEVVEAVKKLYVDK